MCGNITSQTFSEPDIDQKEAYKSKKGKQQREIQLYFFYEQKQIY